MAIQVVRGVAPYWFTPHGQEGDENPTRFRLKGVTQLELSYVMDGARNDEDGAMWISPAGVSAALKYSLVSWEHFHDAHGDPVDFDKLMFDSIPWLYRLRIAQEVVAKGFMGADAEKKS